MNDTQWVSLEEGVYHVDEALLVAADEIAVVISDASLEVYTAKDGIRQVRGDGRVVNTLVVELLEESDQLDLLLDLGADHVYRLPDVSLKAGKVFAANVKSRILYAPKSPWVHLGREAFERLAVGMTRL